MSLLALHEFHHQLGGRFCEVGASEVVADYGDVPAEYAALKQTVGVLDLSFRSRLCLLGADRKKFLHGQVTNQVNELKVGEGCYAALVTAKGKLQSDLFIYSLADELLLDFEPGYGPAIAERLDKYIIADDVQVVPVNEPFGMLSVQGPRSPEVVQRLGFDGSFPPTPGSHLHWQDGTLGDIYLMNQPRIGSAGFDLFLPTPSLGMVMDKLIAAAKELGGRAVGWTALECARIESTIPRFGIDMDETNLPPEAGLESRAISYSKGCYIGQEVIARIRTYGAVAKALRGLKLIDGPQELPKKGDRLYRSDKEIGYVTSSVFSPALKSNVALAYVRKEHHQLGTEVSIRSADSSQVWKATIETMPFQPFSN